MGGGKKQEVMYASGPVQSIDEPLTRSILRQELVAAIATEGELVSVTRVIETVPQVTNRSVV